MKHTREVTLILILLFLMAQIIGLGIINSYIDVEKVIEKKIVIIDGKEETIEIIVEKETVDKLPYGIERPELKEKTSYLSIIFAVIIATILALILLKYQAMRLWKAWFFLSVFFTLMIAFNAFISSFFSLILALALAFLKTFKNNFYIHNFTELFIYGGLAAIFVPVMGIAAMIIVLVVISVYDFIAVFKTKHMIKMAKFQTKIKLFAGLYVPYGKKAAILGGGDLGFPLLFSGVVFRSYGWISLIIVLTSALALSYLLFKSEKNKYYPAMPYLTIGCLIGYGIIRLMQI